MWKRASYRVMRREGSRKINFLRSVDAARKTQTGLANCDGSLFSLRRDGKRKALASRIFYPVVPNKLEQRPRKARAPRSLL